MKLIFCPNCNDVFKLKHKKKYCDCGRSGGFYKEDGLHAITIGLAVPIGLSNPSFLEAYRNRPKSGKGKRFDAFVIAEKSERIEHINGH